MAVGSEVALLGMMHLKLTGFVVVAAPLGWECVATWNILAISFMQSSPTQIHSIWVFSSMGVREL